MPMPSAPLMRPSSAPLRFVATRLALPELEAVVKQPDVDEAFRLTVQYHKARYPDQVATLTKKGTLIHLGVSYRRANDQRLTLDYTIDTGRFTSISLRLRRLNFDKLDDPHDIPWFGSDLWLIERAAGSFHHDLIIAPEQAIGIYAEIVGLIRENLREALRTINS